MTYIWVFAGLTAGFFVLQVILLSKGKKAVVKSIPSVLLIAGLLFCLITYMGVLGPSSTSVMAENQSFAKFLAAHMIAGLAGCALGAIFTKMKHPKQ